VGIIAESFVLMSGPEKEQRSGKIAPARPVILLIAAKGKMAAIALDDCPDGQKVLHLFQPQTRTGPQAHRRKYESGSVDLAS
jgi:hypothetical protein